MYTTNHTERRTFAKYDADRYLLYLGEEKAAFSLPEQEEQLDGYSYTGDMEDGSTIIDAKDVTDENRRGKFIAGLICKRYSIDAQIAIFANGSDTDLRAQELQDFQDYRAYCKQAVDELLSR